MLSQPRVTRSQPTAICPGIRPNFSTAAGSRCSGCCCSTCSPARRNDACQTAALISAPTKPAVTMTSCDDVSNLERNHESRSFLGYAVDSGTAFGTRLHWAESGATTVIHDHTLHAQILPWGCVYSTYAIWSHKTRHRRGEPFLRLRLSGFLY